MYMQCGICKDNFINFENLYAVPCGHVFHHHCITSWLDMGSHTCPQCRKSTGKRTILKLFFDIVEPPDEDKEDLATLRGRNDVLRFEITCKDVEIKSLKKSATEANNIAKELRSIVKTLEAEIVSMQEQLDFHKSKSHLLVKVTKELKEKVAQIELYKRKIERLNGIRALTQERLNESDIRDIVKELNKDDLIEIICANKRETKKLIDSENSLAGHLRSANHEILKLRRDLEQADSKINILQQVAEGLKAKQNKSSDDVSILNTSSHSDYTDEFSVSKSNESPNETKQLVKSKPRSNLEQTNTAKKAVTETKIKDPLGLRNTHIFKPPRIITGNKLLTKSKSACTIEPEYYNGLGGSARLNAFPQAKPHLSKIPMKHKK
ncbi:E3 ubiquitin-protein ligase TRAIP isoform X2 [Cimex lectularius]|uniref:RING-type domain-containing protein n=1 Tax=Cimex lectularius TaxID=79782 RepID=A0A8I6THG8_CIMLE|nr:E3 ubiquitin-protein ligase TRAIP isoform X2 [Cimex lectularius]